MAWLTHSPYLFQFLGEGGGRSTGYFLSLFDLVAHSV